MKKFRNKFTRPRMIWNATLIAEDKAILAEYGLRRKKEIWVAKAMVSDFRRRARELNAIKNKDKELVLLEKINKLGLTRANSLDDVLSIQIKNILDRRLQTLVFKRGLAGTVKQARQLIVHGHVTVDGKKTTFPSYLVPVSEEDKINVGIDVKQKIPEKVNTEKPAESEQFMEEKKEEVEAATEA